MHLLLTDDTLFNVNTDSLTLEVPNPDDPGVKKSLCHAAIIKVRKWLREHYSRNLRVIVRGVIFFDPDHKDWIRMKPHHKMTAEFRVELHPVLGIQTWSDRE